MKILLEFITNYVSIFLALYFQQQLCEFDFKFQKEQHTLKLNIQYRGNAYIRRVFMTLSDIHNVTFRSRHRTCSAKKGALKYFAKFTGKIYNFLIKKRLQHRCFLVRFAKFLRTPIL